MLVRSVPLEGGTCDRTRRPVRWAPCSTRPPAPGWTCPAAPATPTCGSPSRRPSWSRPRRSAAAVRSGSPAWPARCSARSRGASGAGRSSSAASSCRASGHGAGPARPTWPATPPTRRHWAPSAPDRPARPHRRRSTDDRRSACLFRPTPAPRHCSTKPWRDPISRAPGVATHADAATGHRGGARRAPAAARRDAAGYGTSTTLPPACPSRTNCSASAASRQGIGFGRRRSSTSRPPQPATAAPGVRPDVRLRVVPADQHDAAVGPPEGGDRHDPAVVGDELQRGVDGLVRADRVDRRVRPRPGRAARTRSASPGP